MSDSFYRKTGHGDVPQVWSVLEDMKIELVGFIRNENTGLVPDFMGNEAGDFSQPISTFTGISDEPDATPGAFDNAYWYNACRFPWRFAQGYIQYGIEEAREAVMRIGRWVLTAPVHEGWGYLQLDSIRAGYTLDGSPLEGYNYYDRAFAAPFMTALSLRDTESTLPREWAFNELWDSLSIFSEPSEWSSGYYDNSITLLTLLLVTGNWWIPTAHRSEEVSLVSQEETHTREQGTILRHDVRQFSGFSGDETIHLYSPHGRRIHTLEADSHGMLTLPELTPGQYILSRVERKQSQLIRFP
ncbi:hypothetical protein [Chitinivibrio alkaliphilus]|nr:hypothetical protein [Chitinivibrio alkaliphilus]